MTLEKAQELILKYRENVKYISRSLNDQKNREFELVGKSPSILIKENSSVSMRLYSKLDLDLEKQKLERAIKKAAELAIDKYRDQIRTVGYASTKKERDSWIMDKSYFALPNDDEDRPYLILKLNLD